MHCRSRCMDGLTSVNRPGASTHFVTMTTNPQWKEITESLGPGEKPVERPDITARVFKKKFDASACDLTQNHVLGLCLGFSSAVEFQKKGLPHGHIVTTADPMDRPRNADDIDRVVSAELPDPMTDPHGHASVASFMLHGPCKEGVCLINGVCKDAFPQEFRETTAWEGDSFIRHRRRNNGRTCINHLNGFVFDNRRVISCNRCLLLRYNCHICVLVCTAKIASIRCLFAYFLKGIPVAALRTALENQGDEIEQHINGRHVCAHEALWRLHQFDLLQSNPPVERLPVHLPNEHFRILGRVGEQALQSNEEENTQLAAFFELNKNRQDNQELNEFEDLCHTDISKCCTWNSMKHAWKERNRCTSSMTGYSLNRMDNVKMKAGERCHLRLLSLQTANPTSCEDLRTVNEHEYNTFQEACQARGILTDDQTWENTMKEAELHCNPSQVREIFAFILVHSEISDPLRLWTNHLRSMAEDFRRNTTNDTAGITVDIERQAAEDVERQLNKMNSSMCDFAPLRHLLQEQLRTPDHVAEEVKYTATEAAAFRDRFDEHFDLSNDEQSKAINAVLNSIQGVSDEKCFASMAAAGTGKTFALNALIEWMRSECKSNAVCISMSSTALGAQLLCDGHTSHSTVKSPIKILSDEPPRSTIEFDSFCAELLKKAKVLFSDEAFGLREELLEAMSAFFCELHQNPEPFGGLIVVIAGDLRQTLPKVQGGTRARIINLCIAKSHLFRHFHVLRLCINQRLLSTPENRDFAHCLLNVGDGVTPTDEQGYVELPPGTQQVSAADELLEFVYTDNPGALAPEELNERTTLAPLNETVRALNQQIFERLSGRGRDCFSTDSELDANGDETEDVMPEVLHAQNRSGFPLHKLSLKHDSIVMCLRNLSPGICNGTKLLVTNMRNHLIECLILTGPAKGRTTVLPRITVIDDSQDNRLCLRRKQFPIALAHAMTIDKSQGQSLRRFGLCLMTQCFAHGQLYTAISRAVDSQCHAVLSSAPHDNDLIHVENVVWPEVFP